MDNEKLNEYIKNNERINFRLAENGKIFLMRSSFQTTIIL